MKLADIDTSCVKSDQTTCVDGKDGVYFVDSCGNTANIYDSLRADDDSYWEGVITDDLCGDALVDGNADSANCGDCNRFAGGICASASEDNFDEIDSGNFYCKDTSCMFDGESYRNGESWCIYDGKIGDGDDVVGSRHWKYVCNYGVVAIEPCADYRNQICIQSNTFDVNESEVEFRNSACIANNWRKCIDLNGDEDGLDRCAETLNCRIEEVRIADEFHFDVCTPKYPGGFSLTDERYQLTAKNTCGMASQTCTVVYQEKLTGGCEVVANENCLTEGFAIGMNDVCRKLGDCGGEVNVAGKYSENYNVKRDGVLDRSLFLSKDSVNKLVAMATPVDGQFAEVEDYSEYLKAAGLISDIEPPEGGEGVDAGGNVQNAAAGMAGIAAAAATVSLIMGGVTGFAAIGVAASTGVATGLGATAGWAAFGGVAIGAAIGAIAGMIIAKQLGLSPIGTYMMAAGGAMVVGGLVYAAIYAKLLTAGCMAGGVGCIVALVGIVLMIIATFFMGDDCDPVEVTFECKSWQPPAGGGDCEECNGDPLKPCSEYRCESLGAACTLLNKGSEEELCIDGNPNDATPPILRPQFGTISENEVYNEYPSGAGFGITSADGDCIAAHTKLVFGIATDEPAQCKYDFVMNEFADMGYDLGGNNYIYNHTQMISLPDPSNGESRGMNWTGNLTLFVKCRDTHGHETPGFYTVDMCVKQGPDITAPLIDAFSPRNDALISFGATEQDVEVYVNEDSVTCKWDSIDKDYSQMVNDLACGASPSGLYGSATKCSVMLPVGSGDNDYFIRCKDQLFLEAVGRGDERKANDDGVLYKLRKPEKKIEIDWIEPSRDFEVDTSVATVDFQIMTSGGGDWHHCTYSFDGFHNLADTLFQTGTERPHSWPMNWRVGKHKIYVECVDETGDVAQGTTEFRIIKDTSTPQVARIWQSGGKLYVITTEDAECKYETTSCRFAWDDGQIAGSGKEHSFSIVRGKTYYIKCEDEFGHAPSGCSITARAL